MKERWRGPFRVRGYEGTHSTSFTLEQPNGNKIRGSFHEDDLKQFVPRTGHLTENLPPNRSKYPTSSQNIRWRERRRDQLKTKLRSEPTLHRAERRKTKRRQDYYRTTAFLFFVFDASTIKDEMRITIQIHFICLNLSFFYIQIFACQQSQLHSHHYIVMFSLSSEMNILCNLT